MTGAAFLAALAWKSTTLGLLAIALLRWRVGATASSRYQLWCAVVAALLALPLLELVLPQQRWLPALPSMGWGGIVTASGDPHETNWPHGVAWLWPGDAPGDGPYPASPGRFALLFTWAAGAAVCLVRMARDHGAARALVRKGRPLQWPPGLRATVPLLAVRELTVPATFGWWRPVVLLPVTASSWPAARLEAALRHELAHVLRRDAMTQQLAEVMRALYWFNPLSWLAVRRMQVEREFACDAAVLAAGVDCALYADTLLASARQCVGNRRGRGMLAIAGRPSTLALRCHAVLQGVPAASATASWRRLWLLPLLLAGPLAMLGLGLGPAPAATSAAAITDRLLQDPRSERLDADYERLLEVARTVRAAGPDAPAIALLIPALDHVAQWDGDLVRERAIWCLAQAHAGRLSGPLRERLADADWRIRAYAAWGLALTREVHAIDALGRMLDSANWRERAMAAHALAQIGTRAVWSDMTAALSDPHWQVRIVAVGYFAAARDPQASRLLRPLLHDPHDTTRAAVKEAMNRLTD